jgi:hypothetical protein
MDDVPDLTRYSGKHTEEHHLIRCMALEKVKEEASSTEQQLKSLEEWKHGYVTSAAGWVILSSSSKGLQV